MKKSNILMVDDRKENIQLLGSLLYIDYNTEFAMSGEEALKILETETFDLILLDVMMTGIDGYEACRRIKADERLKEIPIIFLSSSVASEFIIKGFKAGGVDYISKPFNKDELLVRVKTHLTIKKLQDSLKLSKTEAKKAELKAQNATRAKSSFLANMSHEIRTPMNAILGYNQLMQRTRLNKKQFDYTNKIQSASSSLLKIINDILDFSKIEAEKLTMEYEVFNLEKIISEMCNIASIKAQNKDVHLVVDIDPDIPQELIGDSLRLNQIFINLINNAIKFSEKAEILFKSESLGNIGDDKVNLQFTVEDNGIGMTEQQLAELFKPFTQADYSTTRKYGGTGLGLAICRTLVDLMDGKIWADSEYGKGSRFIFTASFKVPKNYTKKSNVIPNQIQNLKTLIIDGLPVAKKVLNKMLTSFKCDVHAVDNSEEAFLELEQAASLNTPYQLVLFDYNIPDISCIVAAEKIKNNIKINKKPLILMFVYPFQLDIVGKSKTVGITSLIEKPFCPSDLYNSIVDIFCNKDDMNKSYPLAGVSKEKIQSDIKGALILLVEDNIVNQEICKEFLALEGMNVKVANNGQEALNLLEEHRFDLVLMDLQMPIMDGYEASSIIRQNEKYKDIPIIALTAHALADEKGKCLKAGMNDYISKPFVYVKFMAMISKHINKYSFTKQEVISDKEIELPIIPGISNVKALNMLDNNIKLFKKQLLLFLSSNAEILKRIELARSINDLNEIQSIVHTTKSSSGWIGAEKLNKEADQLEKAIQKKDKEDISKKLELFCSELKFVLNSIKANTSKLTPKIEQAETYILLETYKNKEFISLIDQIIKSFNIDITKTMSLSEELNEKIQNSEFYEEYCTFNDYIELLEVDKASDAIKKLRKKISKSVNQ